MSETKNSDNRPLGTKGISAERICAVEIMEYLGVTSKYEEWYEEEDRVTEMIIDVVDRYRNECFNAKR